MTALRSQIIKGVSWSTLAQFSKQTLSFVIGLILARLLQPSEFGLLGMVMIFAGFANIFIDLGLGAAIIQRQALDQRYLSSIFWINVILGIVLTLGMAALSPLVAIFYKEPVLQPLTLLFSISFLINSLNVVQAALLNKALDFKRLAIIEAVAVSCAGAISIFLAIRGFGVWSLVWQTILLTAITALLTWKTANWYPRLNFDWAALKDVFGFSGNLVLFNILNYWMMNIDNLLIGYFIGSAALGLYSKAYQLMLLPMTQVSIVISRVFFPAFSSIQDDKARIRQIYLKVIQYLALLSFPLMLGLMVTARPFVLVLFGNQWAEMVPILQVFCLAGLFHSIGTTTGWIYMSHGRTDWMFRWGIFCGAIRFFSIILGLRYGSLGVAISYTLFNFLLIYPNYAIPGRLIDLKFITLWNSLSKILVSAIVMAFFVFGMDVLLPDTFPLALNLVFLVLTGIISYGLVLHIIRPAAYEEMLGAVIKRRTATVEK